MIRTVSFVIHCTPTVVGGGGEGLAEEATRISDSSSEDDSDRLAEKDLHNSKFSHYNYTTKAKSTRRAGTAASHEAPSPSPPHLIG